MSTSGHQLHPNPPACLPARPRTPTHTQRHSTHSPRMNAKLHTTHSHALQAEVLEARAGHAAPATRRDVQRVKFPNKCPTGSNAYWLWMPPLASNDPQA